MLLIKKLGTFQRFGICFRVPYSNSNGSGCNATRQRPTGPTPKNPIWRPETGSSYISASNQDIFKISKARYIFRTWPFQWTCALHRPTTSDTRKSNMEAKNWFIPFFSPPYWIFLVSGVVVLYCWRVGWNDRACKHNHTLWNCSNILTISVDVTTSGFPAAILDFFGCRTL